MKPHRQASPHFLEQLILRIALAVEYDGSEYHGWQAQPGLKTIQHHLEQALSRVGNEPITVTCAGRTDTGVHALGQIVHFDTTSLRSHRAWIHGTNAFLPKEICVKWAKDMSENFHARYSATARRYRYVICNTPIRPSLLRRQVTWHYRALNHELMHQAAQCLIGEHDFTSFRSVECQSLSPMRRMDSIEVTRAGDKVMIDITANAFLHHMVRNIAGVLMVVGSGRAGPEWVQEVLLAQDRRQGAETAPAYGLYLVDVIYPPEFEIYHAELGHWLV